MIVEGVDENDERPEVTRRSTLLDKGRGALETRKCSVASSASCRTAGKRAKTIEEKKARHHAHCGS